MCAGIAQFTWYIVQVYLIADLQYLCVATSMCVHKIIQLVDGVLTQDSDAFLYGATVVYRDISTNEKVSYNCSNFQV